MRTFSVIREMAQDIGKSSYSPLKQKEYRQNEYDTTRKYPKYTYQIDHPDISIHSMSRGNVTNISTNDNKTKETVHHAILERNPYDLKFDHDVQNIVERHNTDKLPHQHAVDVMMHHVNKSGIPLVSSKAQYQAGHKMWGRMADRALKSGMHVYYHDGKDLTKTTEDNLKDHLDKSFGIGKEYQDRYMVISKHPIDNQ